MIGSSAHRTILPLTLSLSPWSEWQGKLVGSQSQDAFQKYGAELVHESRLTGAWHSSAGVCLCHGREGGEAPTSRRREQSQALDRDCEAHCLPREAHMLLGQLQTREDAPACRRNSNDP